VPLHDEKGGADVEIRLRSIERLCQLEARALELLVREGGRDVEETRRTGEAGVVALEVHEAEAPIFLPIIFQTLEDVEAADDRLHRDVEDGVLPRSNLACEEDPVGLLQPR
jgi:hypothetical protein